MDKSTPVMDPAAPAAPGDNLLDNKGPSVSLPENPKDWQHGSLFGCFGDLGSCCYGTWCTPCLYGSNQKKLDDSNCCVSCCIYGILALFCAQGCYAMSSRRELRQRHDLKGSNFKACSAHTWCGACAVCQDAREIKEWRKQEQFVTVPATGVPVSQEMKK